MANRASGTIKWFDKVKGHGFIIPDDGGQEVYFHQSEVVKSGGSGSKDLVANDVVEFSVEDGKIAQYAIQVTRK
jgi:cold shock CspA family protein